VNALIAAHTHDAPLTTPSTPLQRAASVSSHAGAAGGSSDTLFHVCTFCCLLLLHSGRIVPARRLAVHCRQCRGHAEESSHTNYLLPLLLAAASCCCAQDALFLPGGSLSVGGDVLDMLERPLTSPTCRCCCCTQDALFLPGGSLSIVGDVVDMLGQPLIPVLLLCLSPLLPHRTHYSCQRRP
jgi:hypothetical protein